MKLPPSPTRPIILSSHPTHNRPQNTPTKPNPPSPATTITGLHSAITFLTTHYPPPHLWPEQDAAWCKLTLSELVRLGEETTQRARDVEKSLMDAMVLVRACCVGEGEEEGGGGRRGVVEEEGGMATLRKVEDGIVERVREVVREEVERGVEGYMEIRGGVEEYIEKRGGVAAGKRSEGVGRKAVLGGRRR